MSGERTLEQEAKERLEAWAGSVHRLVDVAPVEAVINETGIEWASHATPPERKALREKAHSVVAAWLARDLLVIERKETP